MVVFFPICHVYYTYKNAFFIEIIRSINQLNVIVADSVDWATMQCKKKLVTLLQAVHCDNKNKRIIRCIFFGYCNCAVFHSLFTIQLFTNVTFRVLKTRFAFYPVCEWKIGHTWRVEDRNTEIEFVRNWTHINVHSTQK